MARIKSPPPAAGQTLADWVSWAQQQMTGAGLCFGHGTDNPRDEAVWLVSHALGIDPATAGCHGAQVVDSEGVLRIDALVRRRIAQRVPAAYLTGQAWFAGLEFHVDSSTLVPRSPIAELIDDGMPLWPLSDGDAVLDLCTGCGCIAIALAVHDPGLQVTGSDISDSALAVSRRNVQRHACANRVTLCQGDLFAPHDGNRFRLIVSNPPYVPEQERAGLPPEYLHEPPLALVSGDDGLDLPLKILSQAAQYLLPEGDLVLEVGHSEQALQALLPQVPFTWLEFARGGQGVLWASRQLLEAHQHQIDACLVERQSSPRQKGASVHVI